MRHFLIPLAAVSLFAMGCTQEEATSPQRHPSTSSTGTETPSDGNDPPPTNDTNPPQPAGNPPAAGTTVTTETWSDGKTITANVTIGAGNTVTIAPGAKITVSAGVAITVAGTLKATNNATHAALQAAAGGTWDSLVVAKGGTLDVDSLDISGAGKGIWTQTGNTEAKFVNGVITATQPFNMEAGSTLSVTKSSATATAESAIAGTFNASYLTYDKGSAEGLYISDAAAKVTIIDSTLKGASGGDYIVSGSSLSIDVEYTEISGSHCPFHFNNVGSFKIDHVSNNANAYGPMFYGSSTGPNSISYSNLQDNTYDWDVQGTNAKLTIDHSYAPGKTKVDTNNTTNKTVTVTNAATAAVPDAKPRTQQ